MSGKRTKINCVRRKTCKKWVCAQRAGVKRVFRRINGNFECRVCFIFGTANHEWRLEWSYRITLLRMCMVDRLWEKETMKVKDCWNLLLSMSWLLVTPGSRRNLNIWLNTSQEIVKPKLITY